MNIDLNGKVALITGASGTMGAASARVLAGAGAHVVLLGRARVWLEELAEEIGDAASVLEGDVSRDLLTAPSVINAGLLALTKSAADELAPHGIRVNAVNPNAAEGRLGDGMIAQLGRAQGASAEAVRAWLVGATPLGRLVRAEDVAQAVLFLASDLSSFVTGTSLTLDGGAHRGIA